MTTHSTPQRSHSLPQWLVLLLAVHALLLAYSGTKHSPTLNEPAHLLAGLSHWDKETFALYRVNPPLVRMVAVIPVVVMGYEEDWSQYSEHIGARPVFEMGVRFFSRQRTAADWHVDCGSLGVYSVQFARRLDLLRLGPRFVRNGGWIPRGNVVVFFSLHPWPCRIRMEWQILGFSENTRYAVRG